MAQSDVSFDVSTSDRRLIDGIVDRAVKILRASGVKRVDTLSLRMDLTAVHANGCPLRLADLLDADEFNFGHDVFQIPRFIDRDTGKLTQHFRPRFAEPGRRAA